eukprot:4956811-Amphidinium_carterae.1
MAVSGMFVERSSKMQSMSSESSGYDGVQMHVTCGCALHDGMNSFKWSFAALCDASEERLKELYLGVIAYRKGVSAAVDGLAVWLAQALNPLPLDSVQAGEVLQTAYCSLGLEASMLDSVCHDMHLWWNPATSRLDVVD